MLRVLARRLLDRLIPPCYRDLDAQRAAVDAQITELAQ
jgi:hypothetical protein